MYTIAWNVFRTPRTSRLASPHRCSKHYYHCHRQPLILEGGGGGKGGGSVAHLPPFSRYMNLCNARVPRLRGKYSYARMCFVTSPISDDCSRGGNANPGTRPQSIQEISSFVLCGSATFVADRLRSPYNSVLIPFGET